MRPISRPPPAGPLLGRFTQKPLGPPFPGRFRPCPTCSAAGLPPALVVVGAEPGLRPPLCPHAGVTILRKARLSVCSKCPNHVSLMGAALVRVQRKRHLRTQEGCRETRTSPERGRPASRTVSAGSRAEPPDAALWWRPEPTEAPCARPRACLIFTHVTTRKLRTSTFPPLQRRNLRVTGVQ